ncbi:hypothetical protein A0H81_09424 [Grifola frondosa]|uniref:Uncharacterized protein n=1 Tax=Grifola frondosa TaxID=5627 RepID=A0A1C7M0Y3_GRIFR|nr:hypothetical protein A0H81_09424 [Grifola frondosa]
MAEPTFCPTVRFLADAQFAVIQDDKDSIINQGADWMSARVFIIQHHPLNRYELSVLADGDHRDLFRGHIQMEWRFVCDAFTQTIAWYPLGFSAHFQLTFHCFLNFSGFMKTFIDGMVFNEMKNYMIGYVFPTRMSRPGSSTAI